MDRALRKCVALFIITMLVSTALISCGAFGESPDDAENSAEVISAVSLETLKSDGDMHTSEDEGAEAQSATETAAAESTEQPDLSLYPVKVLAAEDSDFVITQDSEGNYYGAADFCIDGESVYILSTSTNTVTEFQHQEVVRKMSFAEDGLNLIQFAVKGNIAYAYAVNPTGSYIVRYDDWKPTASMSIYEFTEIDGFLDFYIIGEELYVVTSGAGEPVTCLIHQEGERLVCYEKRNGKLVGGEYPVDYSKIRLILQKAAEEQAEKDGLVFGVLQGCDDYGTDGENGHYYFSSEFVNDTEKEYLLQRVYHFDEEERLQETFSVPHGVSINTLRPVKVFFGKPWVLYVTEETSEVLLLQEATNGYGTKDGMIDWGILPDTDSE